MFGVNMIPDGRGRISEGDEAAFREFSSRATFARDDQPVMTLRVRPHLATILDRTHHVVVTFSVLGNLLPEPAPVVQLIRDTLLDVVPLQLSDNPFEMLNEAYGVSAEVGRRAELIVHAAEFEAADTQPMTPGAAEMLAACRTTGRSVAIFAPHSESAIGRYLHRHGLRPLVGQVLGRAFAMRNPAVRTMAPVLEAINVPHDDTAVVCATFTAMSAAQRAGAHAIGVERIREPRKILHGGQGSNAVVPTLARLAQAIEVCQGAW